jgi:hypothetical protein
VAGITSFEQNEKKIRINVATQSQYINSKKTEDESKKEKKQ